MRIEKYENDEIPVVVGKGESMYYIYDGSVWKYNGSRPPHVDLAFELYSIDTVEEGKKKISEEIGERIEEVKEKRPPVVTEEKQQENELNDNSEEEEIVEQKKPPFMRDD